MKNSKATNKWIRQQTQLRCVILLSKQASKQVSMLCVLYATCNELKKCLKTILLQYNFKGEKMNTIAIFLENNSIAIYNKQIVFKPTLISI